MGADCTRHELLASKRKTAVTAVAGFNRDDYFVYKHLGEPAPSLARLEKSGLLGGFNVDELTQPSAIAEFDDAGDLREQRIVFAQADVHAGLKAGTALADDNRAAGNQLAAERFHAQPLCIGIAAVLGTA